MRTETTHDDTSNIVNAKPLTLAHPRVTHVVRCWQNRYTFTVTGFDGSNFTFAVNGGEEIYEMQAELRKDGKWHPISCSCPDSQCRKRPCKHWILFGVWGNTIPEPGDQSETEPATDLDVSDWK